MIAGEPKLHADQASTDASGETDGGSGSSIESDDQVAPSGSSRKAQIARVAANLVGALGAVLFARAGLQHYLHTHSLIGGVFFGEQLWIVLAFLVRRPARAVSRRSSDWLLAFGGTFGGVLFRPDGAHLHWGIVVGLGLQIAGLALCITSFFALGRSFGFAPADRGVKRRGPYAIVRHPIYASYFLLQFGYVLQSISVRNILVMILVCGCNVGRAIREERFLVASGHYDDYRTTVRWRLLPGVW
jgi:protein-S-isoprenylcysteine O-methyltransferase Ste14